MSNIIELMIKGKYEDALLAIKEYGEESAESSLASAICYARLGVKVLALNFLKSYRELVTTAPSFDAYIAGRLEQELGE